MPELFHLVHWERSPESESPFVEDAPQAPVARGQRKRYKVTNLAGQEIELLTQKERNLYISAQKKYTDENVFTAASDFRALDRLVLFEVQVFRWQWQLAAACDYDGVDLEASEMTDLRRSIKDTEALISQLQNDLALTKVQRDKAATGDSVSDYIMKLKQRAREHGVRRDKQLGKAIELLNEAFSIAGTYKRSNEAERRKHGFETAEDVIDWLLEVARPMYDEIDQHYRANNQKFWIRDL